jgi:type II secretory pathway pseudopilin PulG
MRFDQPILSIALYNEKEKTMKPIANPTAKRAAFTIVELLTVMSIIVILIGLLVPALNKVKQYATNVKETAQLHAIDTALELFSNEFDGYPDSGALDPAQLQYCGAMKLCEALMGQDLLGFPSSSIFRRDGLNAAGTAAYITSDLSSRKGPYLQAENTSAIRMQSIYGTNVGQFLPTSFVLCDVYSRQMAAGQKTGMPILYYKANTANRVHDPNLANNMSVKDSQGNVYNYYDNQQLVALGKPWDTGTTTTAHKLADPFRFYRNTESEKIITTHRPSRADSYILISAGWDGEYGTADDVCNFDWKYREALSGR